uniref:G_PROTEIN_RECEP_F1_2 domain-containing protein n=1 Tax=Steinernema glaseri TaxID=37863 RepID=A0A1I7ZEM0_9BILA
MSSFTRYPHCNSRGHLDVETDHDDKHRNLFIGTIYVLFGFFTIIPNVVMLVAVTTTERSAEVLKYWDRSRLARI